MPVNSATIGARAAGTWPRRTQSVIRPCPMRCPDAARNFSARITCVPTALIARSIPVNSLGAESFPTFRLLPIAIINVYR
jgi:hypothetical protein